MSDKDWDKLAAFEKAIRQKYGEEAIQNPKANWKNAPLCGGFAEIR